MKSLLTSVLGVSLSSLLVACVIEDAPPRRLSNDPRPTPTAPGGSSNPGDPAPPVSPSPMLVTVDTDQVMTADPGQGVGVFTEYAKGGKWHVWWTCDTAKTRQTCDFAINVTVASGTIADVDASHLQGGFSVTPTASRVEARVTTSSEVHGITFTTSPGAVITLEASVGGIKDGAFLFFVQDGKVNGGYTETGGKLTNPLQLQGNVP